jgi:hypothetical protein
LKGQSDRIVFSDFHVFGLNGNDQDYVSYSQASAGDSQLYRVPSGVFVNGSLTGRWLTNSSNAPSKVCRSSSVKANCFSILSSPILDPPASLVLAHLTVITPVSSGSLSSADSSVVSGESSSHIQVWHHHRQSSLTSITGGIHRRCDQNQPHAQQYDHRDHHRNHDTPFRWSDSESFDELLHDPCSALIVSECTQVWANVLWRESCNSIESSALFEKCAAFLSNCHGISWSQCRARCFKLRN